MKKILLSILATLVLIGVTMPMIGGSLASFCDSETSYDNYIETGDLDLKVNGEDDNPWGTGVEPCFEINDGKLCTQYESSVPLWNAGCVGGTAYLHIKNLVGPDWLSQNVNVEIWYDGSQVTSGSIYDLACHQIELGDLLENATKDVNIVLHATAGTPGDLLTFDIQFELLGGGFCDSEVSQGNYFGLSCELGGTPGFWRNPKGKGGAIKAYGKDNIVTWFRQIVGVPYHSGSGSNWFTDVHITGDLNKDYQTMCVLLKDGGGGYGGAVNIFRAHYLAARLNTKPDPPRLGLDTVHNITHVPVNGDYIDASPYFGYKSGTLEQIIITIESKETDGVIFHEPPSKDDILIMKNVCDALNNVKI